MVPLRVSAPSCKVPDSIVGRGCSFHVALNEMGRLSLSTSADKFTFAFIAPSVLRSASSSANDPDA